MRWKGCSGSGGCDLQPVVAGSTPIRRRQASFKQPLLASACTAACCVATCPLERRHDPPLTLLLCLALPGTVLAQSAAGATAPQA